MTIVITGGSGYIGSKLTEKLLNEGHMVIVIDVVPPRINHKKLFFIQCDLSKQKLPFNVLEQTDAIVNLVGKNVSTKWNDKVKKEIFDSRINSIRHIVESMREATNRPNILINASAVGFYGDQGDREITEKSDKGEGFLSDVVEVWEKEAFVAEDFGTRVVCVRTAPVLGVSGLLSELKKTAKLGFISKLSNNDFWQPWIHEEDIVSVYAFAIETTTLQGIVNAVSPNHIKHSDFIDTIANVLHKKVFGSIPKIISKIVLGESVDEFTKSQKASPQRLLDKGFVFSHPELEEAIRSLK